MRGVHTTPECAHSRGRRIRDPSAPALASTGCVCADPSEPQRYVRSVPISVQAGDADVIVELSVAARFSLAVYGAGGGEPIFGASVSVYLSGRPDERGSTHRSRVPRRTRLDPFLSTDSRPERSIAWWWFLRPSELPSSKRSTGRGRLPKGVLRFRCATHPSRYRMHCTPRLLKRNLHGADRATQVKALTETR